MRATILLEHLLGKLSLLNHAVSTRAQLPALTGFLIEAEKGKIKISSSDLEIGVIISIPAGIDEEGRALVPAKLFTELLSALSEEKITIEKKEQKLSLVGKRTRASLLLLDDAEFPKVLEERGDKLGSFKRADVEKGLLPVVFAAAQDASRPAFSAVFIKPEKEGVVVVATDSHRLSKNILSGTAFVKEATPTLVSARTIKALLSADKESDIDAYVSPKHNQISFQVGDDVLVGRLIDAEYPDFEKIIPADSATTVEVNAAELVSSLKTAAVFARDNANIVRFSVGKYKLALFAKSATLGENMVELPAKTKGEENEIAFNSRYVLELLQNIDAEDVVFEMTGPLNPGVFKISGNNSFVHLIMPIRVREEEI